MGTLGTIGTIVIGVIAFIVIVAIVVFLVTLFAKTDGYLYITPVTSVPSFIFEVMPASTDRVVQPSSIGSSGFPITTRFYKRDYKVKGRYNNLILRS